MKILDLFCGTKSISNAFARRGHEVFTVDWDLGFSPSLCADVGTLTAEDIIQLCGGIPDVIWASPDCTTYSVAAISHHRKKGANGELLPVTEYAKKCDGINRHLMDLIQQLSPKFFSSKTLSGARGKWTSFAGCLDTLSPIVSMATKDRNRPTSSRITLLLISNLHAAPEALATNPRLAEVEQERRD